MSEAAGSTDEPEAGPSNQGQQRTVNSVKDMVLDAVMSDPDIMRAMNDGIRVESHEAKQQKHESTNGEPCKVSHEREEVKKYMSPLKDQDESIIAVGPQTDKLDWKNKEIDLKKQLDLLNLVMDKSGTKNVDEAKKKKYQFWETQPVPNFDESISDNGPIEADKPISELRKEPYSLPGGFVWKDVNLSNDKELKELYTLLNENYVEDDDNMFRFDYSPEFLLWALKPPGWNCDWHVGVRVAKSDKLIGFIAAVPCIATIYEKSVDMVEINFLCVHKKLRAKRVAPVLIREITRRVNMKGIFQAVYTAGVILPKPISTCRYWHRSLNPKKLIDVNFSHLGKNMTLARTLKLYRLPDEAKTPGLRQMTAVDIPVAYKLLTEYLNKFDIAPKFTMEEFQHWFAPRLDVVDSYVVEKNGDLVDFISFYTLPSTIMHHQQHKSLKAAYAFYNVANSTPWVELMTDALILAKKNGYDVFNALDLMDNKEFLEKLKFGIGDGDLQYYLYNWKCPEMTPNKVGLVLQ